jgi:8-oxo-dGTP diphosphatase
MRYNGKALRLTLIECNPKNGSEPQALEHQQIRWVTVDQMEMLEFAPADQELIDKLFC